MGVDRYRSVQVQWQCSGAGEPTTHPAQVEGDRGGGIRGGVGPLLV